MGPKPLIVIGAGGHAKVVVSLLRELGLALEVVLDDAPEKRSTSFLGLPVIGASSLLEEYGSAAAVIAVGRNSQRKELAERYDHVEWPVLIHPRAYVADNARLGPGTVVMAGAVVQPDAVVGAHCIVNTNSTVEHDCLLGDYVHIGPGATLTGEVEVGEGCLIGAGSTVLPGVDVGAWSLLGAGSVANRPIPPNSRALGVPARCSRLRTRP